MCSIIGDSYLFAHRQRFTVREPILWDVTYVLWGETHHSDRIPTANKRRGRALRQNHSRIFSSSCCWFRTGLGLICTVVQIRLQYPRRPHYGNDPFTLVLSRHLLRPAALVTPMTLATDAYTKTLPQASRLRLLCMIAEMRCNARKQTKASQQGYKWHHGSQERQRPCFCVSHLEYVDPRPLLTSAAT